MTDGLWLWCGFLVCGFLRKISPTQLWVELSWVVAINQQNLTADQSGTFYGTIFYSYRTNFGSE